MSIVKLFKLHNGSAGQFEQLISPHISNLYRFSFRLCQSADDAEELVQLLLTRLFLKLKQLEQVESLRPWLMRALFNLYVDSYRKQQRMSSIISPEEMPENTISTNKSPYQETELTHNQQIIVNAMQTLNDDQRLVMLLHDAEGYTLPELADILQTPIGTLKSRLHRARSQVREMTAMELFGDSIRDISEQGSI